MPYARYSAEEVAERGETLYKQQIQHKLREEDKGKFLIIDIETGNYEVDSDDLTATKRALAKRPEAVLYGLRIGLPAAYRLGTRVAEIRR